MELREQPKERRERLGMRIEDVATLLGMSKQIVSAWERGARIPPTEKLMAWAKALGVDLRVTAEEAAPNLTDEQKAMLERLARLLPTLDRKSVRLLEAQIDALAEDDVKKVS